MPWAAVIGAGVSLFMGNKASKKQDKAMDQQAAAAEAQLKLGREQLGFAKDQYSDWKAMFDPAYARMMNELDQDLTPNYGAIAGDVSSSFQSARGQELRDMQRYGIKPTDGGYRGMSRQYGINEAAAHVGARSQARESKRGLKFARLQDASNMLVGMQGVPAQMMSQGYGAASNALGNQANMYGQHGAINYGRGMSDAYGAGAMIGGIDWGGIWGDVKGWFGNSGGNSNSGNGYGII